MNILKYLRERFEFTYFSTLFLNPHCMHAPNTHTHTHTYIYIYVCVCGGAYGRVVIVLGNGRGGPSSNPA